MKVKSLIIKFSNAEKFEIPARIIAEHRANYYASLDGYEKESNEWYNEINFALNDEYEIIDWTANNMDWKDLEPFAVKVEPESFNYEENWGDAELELQ